ncbi:hypothetical protein HER39_02335 [Arthrobacter deserti]|uniref:Uncharacterized protein n=1 Tax=Arthrobacter deserti TaxID=1742687 RepID=A0ABX1JMI6_9MICC|nr:hypothetical protein [Arthrobacter deserti]
MKLHLETSTLPLSIASIDSTVYLDTGTASAPASGLGAPAGLSQGQTHMLAAVACRAGEGEAAEWALDQANASCEGQIVAALSAGLSYEMVAEAAGLCTSAIAEVVAAQAPRLV